MLLTRREAMTECRGGPSLPAAAIAGNPGAEVECACLT